jgi:hypothetical protein
LRRALATVAPCLLLACGGDRTPPDTPRASFAWPVPDGWKKETIPFPLDFARELPYRGVEELRFMPGFFDPASSGFWSYTFAWWIEGHPVLDTATLTSNLHAYFLGLARAVAEGKFPVDDMAFQVSLVPGERRSFSGALRVLDAFTTRKPIDLLARAEVTSCGAHTVVLFRIAPPPWTPAKAAALDGSARAFRCLE